MARARIAQAEASAEAALASFDGTWLRALEETESALTRYASELDRLATLAAPGRNSAEAARIARLRYQAGREPLPDRARRRARRSPRPRPPLAQSEAQLSDNLIAAVPRARRRLAGEIRPDVIPAPE